MTLEDEMDAKERTIQFSQCRASFQPFKVHLKEGIFDDNEAEAYGYVNINKKSDQGDEEVARLHMKLIPPQRPAPPPSSNVAPSQPPVSEATEVPPKPPVSNTRQLNLPTPVQNPKVQNFIQRRKAGNDLFYVS